MAAQSKYLRGWLIFGSAGTLFALLLAYFGLAPLYFYNKLQNDSTTGERVQDFQRLINTGPYGVRLARLYARDTFRNWRSYGRGYVRTPGIIPIGSSKDLVRSVLGKPDIDGADHDIWWMNRDHVGRKMFISGVDEEIRYDMWNRRMVAEYNERGYLERLFIPNSKSIHEADYPAPERSLPQFELPPTDLGER